MRKIFFFIIAFLAISKISPGQSYTWEGSVSTDYQVPGNWIPVRTAPSTTDTLSFNAVSPTSITNVANQTVGAIQIAAGTSSVTFSTNVPTNVLTLADTVPLIYTSAGSILAGNFLTIQLNNASSFTISSGVFGIAPGSGAKVRINGALVLDGGTLDIDKTGTGGTTINGPAGSITYNSGTFICTRASSLTWAPGSNYYHGVNGSAASAIPTSTWQTGSTCNITGMDAGTFSPTGLTGIDFANFTWNCPLQNGNINLLPIGGVITIKEILTIAGTGGGSGSLRVSTGKATARAAAFLQTDGNLILQAGADTTTLTISGDFSQTGGIFDGVGGSAAGTAIVDLKGNVTRGADASWQSTSSSPGSQSIFQFSGTGAQTVNVLSGTWNAPNAGRCNIVNNNTDNISGINLTGVLRVYNTNSSLVPATLTMKGVITGGSGGVTYTGLGSGGTTLIYAGSFFQAVSGIEFPASNGPLNLTINNTLGVSFPTGFNRALGGRLSLLSGNLAVGAGDTLSLTNLTLANQLSYTGGFITTGTVGRYFPTTGLPTSPGTNALFPFGSGVNSRFLNIFFSSGTLSGGTAGMIYVSHSPIVGTTSISLADNNTIPITLDKRTDTKWTIGTGAFNLGGGGSTVSITAVGANIGSVNNYTYLRLTDGVTPNFGTLIATTGSNAVPTVGKSGLLQADLNKTLYIASDSHNPLIIITYTWTGLGGNTNWVTPGNWTGGPGYPSASTEIAIISSTSGTQPTINTGTTINVYQLTVSSGMTLTMAPSAGISVYDDIPNFGGTAIFAPSSTFGYASSDNPQTLLSLPYGNLAVSGTAPKTLPAAISVTGDYIISGAIPVFTNNTFTYAGAGAQRITSTTYDNLTITGDRGNALITLGNAVSANTIDIKNVFNVSTLSNYTTRSDFNTVRFSSPGTQTIPGFLYATVTNVGGTRILDPLGSTDPAHVISCRSLNRSGSVTPYTVDNSKVKFYVSGTVSPTYTGGNYFDLEISGNLNGFTLDFFNSARVSIAGKFTLPLTNFKQGTANVYTFDFNGTGDQTITAFKADSTTNTPAFKYSNLTIAGGNRNVTLGGGGTDTIAVTGNLMPERNDVTGASSPFAAGKGFIVTGSTVDFSRAGSVIPVLKPAVAGGNNYHNVVVSSGSRLISDNMTIGGSLTVSGTDQSLPTSLTVTNGIQVTVLNIP